MSDLPERLARLRAAGGARLGDPVEAARAAAADPFAELRLAIFRALADPNRFLIAELLRRHGPLSTTEIEAALGVANATVSHHLRVLETARVVVPERVERWTFWRLLAYPLVETLVPKA
ncbi:MAG TPA: metalloregulator ArsR/SmtB family transcription factor [Candidatus Thermoplasmatota archaeon]|nr:metalloregulator ArsR/SmtB family transcription factor [Candidatus Thermoplasmatota archaeon]